MDDHTQAQIAASGAFLGGGPGQPPFFGDQAINCDNPFLSAAMVTQFCGGDRAAGDVLVTVGRRNVEGDVEYEHDPCRECGYDVRASRGKCPECVADIASRRR